MDRSVNHLGPKPIWDGLSTNKKWSNTSQYVPKWRPLYHVRSTLQAAPPQKPAASSSIPSAAAPQGSAPRGARRTVPEFLQATVDRDRWQQACDQMDQAVGDNSQFRKKLLGTGGLYGLLIGSGFYFSEWMQELACTLLYYYASGPALSLIGGLCPVEDFWDNPLLALCFFFLFEAGALYYYAVPGMVDLSQKRDKILRNIASKVRYVCEDWNDDNMYLWARPNYEMGMITVDVYRSKPPAEPRKIRTLPNTTSSERSDALIVVQV